MNTVRLVVLILVAGSVSLAAQEPRWTVDVTPASYVEAWELNDSRETLTGMQAGVDRAVWRGLALRAEWVVLHVVQSLDNTWVGGGTVGMRARVGYRASHMMLDIAGGRARAGDRVPPTGTRSNYILMFGGGVEIPWSRMHVTAGARWLHLSNAGSQGRQQNPDIQSLGGFVGCGWRF